MPCQGCQPANRAPLAHLKTDNHQATWGKTFWVGGQPPHPAIQSGTQNWVILLRVNTSHYWNEATALCCTSFIGIFLFSWEDIERNQKSETGRTASVLKQEANKRSERNQLTKRRSAGNCLQTVLKFVTYHRFLTGLSIEWDRTSKQIKNFKKNSIYYGKTQHVNFRGRPPFRNYKTTLKRWKMRCETLICFTFSCLVQLFWFVENRHVLWPKTSLDLMLSRQSVKKNWVHVLHVVRPLTPRRKIVALITDTTLSDRL